MSIDTFTVTRRPRFLCAVPSQPPDQEWAYQMARAFFIGGVATNGVAIGAGRLLFNSVVPQEKSTAYTSIHYAWMGLTGGLAPLLAGGLLTAVGDRRFEMPFMIIDSYAVMFGTVILFLAAAPQRRGQLSPCGRACNGIQPAVSGGQRFNWTASVCQGLSCPVKIFPSH